MSTVSDRLLASDEPPVRYKVRALVIGEPTDSPEMLALREEIRQSPRARQLLADRGHSGRIRPVHHAYKKWIGAHWVMAESGHINDPRCGDALDLLESKRLSDGGWPAEQRFYKSIGGMSSNSKRVSWGGASAKRMNEWVTADALYVLSAAGRLRG